MREWVRAWSNAQASTTRSDQAVSRENVAERAERWQLGAHAVCSILVRKSRL
jgi:hypothetical protein